MLLTISKRAVNGCCRRAFASSTFATNNKNPDENKPAVPPQPQFPEQDEHRGRPPLKPDRFALYSILDTKPFSFPLITKFLSRLPSSGETELASDTIVPPKVHENSVFVYQSIHLAEWFKLLRNTDWLLGGLYLATSTYPFLFFIAVFGHYLGWAGNCLYSTCRHLVIRMDVLPHIESVAFQKIKLGGLVTTTIVPISDLEYVKDPLSNAPDAFFWTCNKATVDRKLAFRSRTTDELFLFDKEGFWSEEGLKHPLIY